ncbi:response regulator receiver domain-containing protein [Geothermobacter ehrlichii]|uniref:Response regulator receiver domain-containing protein n=1 Tax=Geothermobacter ehrlichii TaxID=213224 RepID=A0A5D3WLB1_9BACT|nr:response regulator [Geothermobacter ehrlichii]TYO98753.1 response regulator receiver domain-containing protein [Geothermobacter ehrlichii]
MSATVLIIEDEPAVLQLEKRILERMGCRVLAASSAELGLEVARKGQLDLILLDVMLEGASGFDLARQLRQEEQTRKIPIVFVTAKDEPQDMIEGFATGGLVYLTKPFSEKNLETAIRSVLPPQE